ncbi:hypothetical protein RHAL1_00239 [Beijerinckiaceae bacterium RH AL1]|nr:hypothetical protein RHAL8_00236 [Beijerinckiaceae bacterium RH AL8]VVB42538.1 hypothetical protein RHCH11_RHCH11_00236 [Beijerinckiaceae bacterium RH CH11]VVC53359.1 hypothetical protein RHAL1_00239 [Beijerinckiaceae bacterium RH AL1]
MPSVVDRLLNVAANVPDAPAVVEDLRVFSYAELAERAAAFAGIFAQGPRRRVLIVAEKGFQAYAAMFGSLMAGATYAPVAVDATQLRLQTISASFEPDTIVAHPALAASLTPPIDARIIAPDEKLVSQAPDSRSPDDIAYVIFTSGSTGAPKGVAVPRTGLDHYVDWIGPAMGLAPGDRMSQHPNIGFDLSVLDIYGALCHGAALHPFIDRGSRLLPARKVQNDRITVWNSVPSVLSIMETARELDAAHLESVRLFTFCGEVLRRDHVAKLFAARPDAIVLNTYGPTEATVAMTCRRFTVDDWDRACSTSAPFGEAIGDMRLDLVGGDDGDEGEIVISGPQLARFYWNDPALTAEKFRDHTLPDGRVVKAFFTGDYARRSEGDTYFLGRRDDMVKVRGHRMHVGAVSQALEKIGWPTAVAFEKGGQLFAAVERVQGRTFDQAEVIAELSGLLESYSVPSEIRCFDAMPKNQNDKIDGAKVRAMFESGSTR